MNRVEPYLIGVIKASVCVAADADAAEIEEAMNRLHPTGISSPWRISTDPTFATGQANPCACDRDADRLHWLLDC